MSFVLQPGTRLLLLGLKPWLKEGEADAQRVEPDDRRKWAADARDNILKDFDMGVVTLQ